MSFFRGFGKQEEKGGANQGLQSPSTPGKTAPPPPIVQDENISIRLEDEPAEDPERTALESEVRDRDNQISVLERARQEKKDQLDALEKELEKERLTQMSEALIHKIESERIKRMTAHAEDRLQALEQDMQDKAAIHEYANLIKGVAPKGGVDSQYVMKLQAQLQKAVKKMETTMGQMKELEHNARENVEQLSNEITQLIHERCKTELDLRKQIEVMEEQKKEMQVEYEARIRENLKTLKSLRAKAVKQSTIEELEEELQETEAKLEELSRIHEKQTISIEQLTKSLSSQGDM